MQVLRNGEKSECFRPERGIRQGDPLSPYLFVLCMDKLGHMIDKAVQSKSWCPLLPARDGPSISHLFFADDLILFAEASVHQANIILLVM